MKKYLIFNINQTMPIQRSVSDSICDKKKPVLIKPKLKRQVAVMPSLFNLSCSELVRSQTY